MNRKEFIDTLDGYLDRLPDEERKDALNYYRELFDDAGAENEQKIIDDLGDPKDISRQLLIENGISPDPEPEFPPEKISNANDGGSTSNQGAAEKPVSNDNNRLLLIVIILVVTAPAWLGIVGGVLGTLFGIFMGIVGVVIGLYAMSLAFIIAGVAMLFAAPPIGMMMLGGGLVIGGLMILISGPLFRGIVKLISWVINGIVSIFRKLLNKGETR